MKISNKEYKIEKCDTVFVGESESLKPYGYSIEIKFRNRNDIWYSYGNKIYGSKIYGSKIYGSLDSAMGAIIQMFKSSDSELRVVPLYKLEGSSLREYRISEILGDIKPRKLSDLKAWKLKKDFEYPIGKVNKKGTIFIQLENGIIVKSGQIDKTVRYWNRDLLTHLNNNDIFGVVELSDEKWIYPHLLKELKNKLKDEKDSRC